MKKILITLIIILLINQISFAIIDNLNEQKINLENAINIALKTNPQIQASKLNIEIAKNNIKIANKLKNPDIETFQNIGKLGEENPQQIGAKYEIELFKRKNRKNLAKSELISTQKIQNISEMDLILDVKKAYIDFLLKKSNLKILKEQQNLTKELYETIQKEVQKGNLAKSEAIQAKIALNKAIMSVNIAKSQVIYSQNRFNSIMNTSDINYDTQEDILDDNYSKLLTINPERDLLEFEKIKNFALNQRTDIKKALQDIEIAQMNLKLTKSQLIPDIELFGGYGYITSNMSPSGKYVQGDRKSVV